MRLCTGTWLAALLALTGCFKGPGFLKQGPGGQQALTSISDTGAAIIGASGTTQLINAPSSSPIANASLSLPPGVVAIGTEVSLVEGASISTAALEDELGLPPLTAAGPAVLISAPTVPSGQLVLSLPFDTGAGLALADDTNLVVVYRAQTASGYVSGVITRDQLTIVGGKVSFSINYFGSYQLARTATTVTAAKEVATSVPAVSKKAEAAAQPVVYGSVNSHGLERDKAEFATSVTGLGDVAFCLVRVDRDATFPWDRTEKVPAPYYAFAAPESGAYAAQFVCVGKDGRTAPPSPWSAAVQLTVVASQQTNNPTLDLTAVTGTQFGDVALGGTRVLLFKLANTTAMPQPFNRTPLPPPFGYVQLPAAVTIAPCQTGLAPGETCAVAIIFSPTAIGPQVMHLGYAGTQILELTGAGVQPGHLTLAPTNLALGSTLVGGAPVDGQITLTNGGNTPVAGITATLTAGPVGFKGGFYPGAGGTCTGQLPPGASCILVIEIHPATVGAQTAQLSLNYTDGSGNAPGPLVATVTGSGRPPAPVILSGAFDHSCAILENHSVKCWGYNHDGQLGLGDTMTRGFAASQMGVHLPALSFPTSSPAVDIAAGGAHTCVVFADGTAKCWGQNTAGQLGDGTTTSSNAANSAFLLSGSSFIRIVAGASHTCALTSAGTVFCWGSNGYAQLGNGSSSPTYANTPMAISLGAGRSALEITAGSNHTCVLLDNHSVKCWGDNSVGQLGQGVTTAMLGNTTPSSLAQLSAVNLGTGRTAQHIYAGWDSTCALLDNQVLKCWGNNPTGKLGLETTNATYGTTSDSIGDLLAAVNVGANNAVKAVSIGALHICAALTNDELKCWGDNQFGERGTGNTTSAGAHATEMGDGLDSTALPTAKLSPLPVFSTGDHFSCAVGSDLLLYCWGDATTGQIGQGSTTQLNTPAVVDLGI